MREVIADDLTNHRHVDVRIHRIRTGRLPTGRRARHGVGAATTELQAIPLAVRQVLSALATASVENHLGGTESRRIPRVRWTVPGVSIAIGAVEAVGLT